MPLADARAICPDIATRPADLASEAASLASLRRWASRYAPMVGVDAQVRQVRARIVRVGHGPIGWTQINVAKSHDHGVGVVVQDEGPGAGFGEADSAIKSGGDCCVF